MKIGLFDLYSSGHHLPYASRIKRALETVSEHDVTFIALSETDQCTELFNSEEILYLDAPESPPIEDRDESFDVLAETKIKEFCSGDSFQQFDVVHFLYADTILGPLWRHCPTNDDVRCLGELNGTFFHRGTVLRRQYLHQMFLRFLQSHAGRAIDLAVPERTSHEALWEDLYLYRCLSHRTFDQVIVHSQEASEYLSRLATRQTSPVKEIPYPAPKNFGNDISKSDARRRLDLPLEDSILLFFGSMRGEKGINFLLDALRRYHGPTFTIVLAGPPIAVSEQEIEKLAQSLPVNVIYELGFIDTPELYYRAADAVILPYRRRYGKERFSQLFQEVCSSLRPVIVPDFGALGRLTEQWELGATYEQSSIESLVATLTMFASDGVPFSRDRMQEYNNQHSYEQVAVELSNTYQV